VDAQSTTNPPKHVVDKAVSQERVFDRREEMRVGRQRPMQADALRQVGRQHFGQLAADRHQASLVEFRVSDHQKVFREVHIGSLQRQRFAKTKGRAIEEHQERPKGNPEKRISIDGADLHRLGKETLQLLTRIDVRIDMGRPLGRFRRQRGLRYVFARHGKAVEHSQVLVVPAAHEGGLCKEKLPNDLRRHLIDVAACTGLGEDSQISRLHTVGHPQRPLVRDAFLGHSMKLHNTPPRSRSATWRRLDRSTLA